MPSQSNYAAVGVSSYEGGGSVPWSNPDYATGANDGFVANAQCDSATSEWLRLRSFGFSIPSGATIDGIRLNVLRRSHFLDVYDQEIRLIKGGVAVGDDKSDTLTAWPIGDDFEYGQYGDGFDDLWGETWESSDINSSGFGIVLAVERRDSGEGWASVDNVFLVVYYHFEEVGSNGASIGGVAIVDPAIMDGGVQGSGDAQVNDHQVIEVSGGTQASGSATHSFSIVVGGGIELSGAAIVTWENPDIDVSGGVIGGGLAARTTHDVIDLSGGVSVGGEPAALNFYGPLGGMTVSGEASVISGFMPSGGVSGSGVNISGGVHNLSGEGGIKAGGVVGVSGVMHRIVVADGGVEVELSGSDYGITDRSYNGDGGVYVSNVNDPTIVNHRFNLDIDILWNLRTYIIKDLTFFWSTGLLVVYWYRVLSKPIECDCCKKMITNVHARTVAELCEKLSDRNWTWQIDTIEKFRRPAALGNAINGWENQQEAIDEYDLESTYDNCNDREPIEFCDVPQCANYCVDFDLKVSFAFDMSKHSVDAFHSFESGNEESEDRTIYTGGGADTTHWRNTPDFPYESSAYGADPDGNETDPQRMAVELSGSAVVWSSHPRSDGGFVASAVEAHTSFTNWQYIGGVWPFSVTARPHIAESVSSVTQEGSIIEGDQPWVNIDNALLPDGSDAFTDISWSKNSEFLVLRDFRLNIPLVGPRGQDVKIDRIQFRLADGLRRWVRKTETSSSYLEMRLYPTMWNRLLFVGH